jgi:hypothetical protein
MSCKTGIGAAISREFRLRRFRGTAAAVASALAIFTSCGFMDNLNKPFEYTAVTCWFVVMDSTFNRPIKGAAVVLDGVARDATTDSNGLVNLSEIRTGTHTVAVIRDLYKPITDTIDLTLEPQRDTLRLVRYNVKPTIESFFINPANLVTTADTAVFICKAFDSSGGGIAKIIIATGKGDASIEKNYDSTTYYVNDTVKFLYDSVGKYRVHLTVMDKNSELTKDTILVTVPDNDRPTFSELRFSTDGFINGKWEYIQFKVSDTDTNFSYLTINWGDTSQTYTSTDTTGAAHWHMYNFSTTTTVNIAIQLFDRMGARTDTTLSGVVVRTFSPPKLDNSILFVPSPPLTPLDDTVHIGVKVLEINSMYVQEIDWILNPEDPATIQSVRKTFTSQTGAVSPTGTEFFCDFSTAKLKSTNIVQIVVKDRLQTSSSVLGSLYIAGKPN